MNLCVSDVHRNDRHVPGRLVSLFPGVSLGVIRRPEDHPSLHGHHRPTLCQVLHVLQPLHLRDCQQEVSGSRFSSVI